MPHTTHKNDPLHNLRFDGRTAVVTGAARGIGFATAKLLAAGGAKVILADLNGKDAEAAALEIDPGHNSVLPFDIDVSDPSRVQEMMQAAQAFGGSLDILVNNAGITTTQIVAETDPQAWNRVLDVNLTGPFLCCQAAMPYMVAQQYGKIINVASVAAKRISFNAGASYTASKAGLLAFTRHLAYEAAPDGISVNAICPGPVMTPMLESMADTATLAARRASVPRGRLTTPEDQARIILFYASDLTDLVCGTALDVDGGALLGWYDVDTYFQRRGAPRQPR